jgi:hypothetical protein
LRLDAFCRSSGFREQPEWIEWPNPTQIIFPKQARKVLTALGNCTKYLVRLDNKLSSGRAQAFFLDTEQPKLANSGLGKAFTARV